MAVKKLRDGTYRARREASIPAQTADEAERADAMIRAAIEDAKRRYYRGDRSCIALSDATIADFLAHQSVARANDAKSLASYRARLRRFAERFADRPLESIGREKIERWIADRLRAKGHRRRYCPAASLSRDTVNADLKALRAFCRWAISRGLAPAGLEILSVPTLRVTGKIRGNRYPPRALVRHNFLDILRRINRKSPQLALVLRGMILLGARPAALFAINRADIQMPTSTSAGSVALRPTKGGAEGSIAIPPGSLREALFRDAIALFARYHGRRPRADDPAFPSRRGKLRSRPLGWSSATFANALRKACGRLRIRNFSAYTARHSAITWLQQQPGVSAASIQSFARHLQVTTQEAYSHRTGAEAERAYAQMETAMSGESGSKAPRSPRMHP